MGKAKQGISELATRRQFLKASSLGLLSGAVVVGAARGEELAGSSESVDEGKHQGYHETEHIRTYYRLARF